MTALRTTGSWSGPDVVKKQDGTLFDVFLTSSLVKNDKGIPISTIATFMDITERIKAENYMEATFSSMASPIALIDEEGIIITTNQAGENSQKKMVGQSVPQSELVPITYQYVRLRSPMEMSLQEKFLMGLKPFWKGNKMNFILNTLATLPMKNVGSR